MTNPQYDKTQVRTPDWSRITRAKAPRIAGVVPLLQEPIGNANAVLNKSTVTINRAGSDKGNPILAGLGVRAQIGLGLTDRLLGLYLYQDPQARGANLVGQVSVAGQYATFDFLAGSGQTVAGDASTGSARNFLRFVTGAGTVDHQFWIKHYDADVVKALDQACLDPATLLPVAITLTIIDVSRPWIDVPVDFMVSWADEFQALGNPAGQQGVAGFRKAYGGALWVSFFDKTPGTEGTGVQVNPITQAAIATTRSIQVQNTAGLKEVTVRFRSETDSSFFVDVPIKFNVVAPPSPLCDPPFSEPCSVSYRKAGTVVPTDCPEIASVPAVQTVAGTPGDHFLQDLLIITVHGTSVTAAPKLRIIKWEWVANAQALVGADLQQIGSAEDYLPLILSGTSPVESSPYGSPHRLVVALSVAQLSSDLVAFMDVVVLDGDDVSTPICIPGPRARDVALMPIGLGGRGSGGGDLCLY